MGGSPARSRLHACAPARGGDDGHPERTAVPDRHAGAAGASLSDLHGCARAVSLDETPEPPDAAPDPRTIDTELRALITSRQRHEAALADRLRGVVLLRSYRDDGLASLETYARERLGVSPRRAYYLLSLERTLARLPELRAAFTSGKLSMKQALLVGSVASVVTVGAWITRASAVSLRRLEDEVGFWLHLKDVRPEVWSLLDGGPLPEGLGLAPGLPPRLHACASSEAITGAERSVNDGSPSQRNETKPTDGAPRPAAMPITAGRFLEALQERESALPLPSHPCRIRLRVAPGVNAMWHETLARYRESAGAPLKEWEVFVLLLAGFWKTWDNAETRRQRRENPVLERDGWRCTVPGNVPAAAALLNRFQTRAATGQDSAISLASANGLHAA